MSVTESFEMIHCLITVLSVFQRILYSQDQKTFVLYITACVSIDTKSDCLSDRIDDILSCMMTRIYPSLRRPAAKPLAEPNALARARSN